MRIVTAVGFSALMLTAGAALAGREVIHEFKMNQPRGAVLRLVVDIPLGDVTVTNGADNTIELTGSARHDYGDSADIRAAQRIVDDASATIDVVGSRAIVRPRFGKMAGSWRNRRDVSLSLNLRIPKGMHVEVQQRVGEVNVDGDFGDIEIDLRVGEVNVTTPKRNVREVNASTKVGDVSTDVGDRIIKREGVLPGRTQFFSDGGTSTVRVDVRVGDVDIKLTR